MITCKYCNDDFEPFGQKRRPICRPCKRKYDNAYYANRSMDDKDRKRRLKNKRSGELRVWINNHRNSLGGCVDCGNDDHRVLDFDHLPEYEKEFNIGDASGRGYSKKRILKEMDKCEVVCSNCHRIRTYERDNGA